jgi:hypothetical protein
LRTASAARVRANPEFAKIEAFGKLLQARQDKTTEPLELQSFRTRRAKEKAELDAADPKLKDQKPLFEVVDGSPAAANTAGDKKLRQRLDAWKNDLARDPWVKESLHVLEDMAKK